MIMRRHRIQNFRRVFSNDMLPTVRNSDESCVINIEDYFKGNGTHWVCVFNDSNSPDVEYFDSFGLPPPDLILGYMKTGAKGIVYNNSEIQEISSIMCGYYCCYFIIKRFDGYEPLDILLQFDQDPSNRNENIIRNVASFM